MDIQNSGWLSSLRVKLPVGIFCIIITVSTLSTYFILRTFNTSISDVKNDYVLNITETIATNVALQLRQTHRDLRMTATYPRVIDAIVSPPESHEIAKFQNANKPLIKILENVKNVYGYYDSLFLADAYGEYLIGSRASRMTAGIDGDRRLIEESIASVDFRYAPVLRNSITNELLLPVILQIKEGNSLGALVASVQMNKVITAAIEETPHDTVRCFAVVVNHTGMELVDDAYNVMLPQKFASFYGEILASASGIVSFQERGGETILSYYNVPNTDIYIVGAIDKNFKSAQLNSIRDTMTLTGVGMAILMLFAVSVFTFPLVNKIVRISNFARKVSEGTNETSINVQGNDEVGSLARSLERTVETLRDMVTRSEAATKAKSDFLARMSHEIRTPMNGIIGMTYLAMRANPDEKQKQYLERIDNAAKGLLSIINDILDFSKIEAEKMDINPTSFRIETVFSSLRDILLPKCAEKSIAFTYTIDANVPEIIRTDPVRVTQICTNLCSNAVKFTSRGSVHLHLGLQGEQDGKLILAFSVQDTGIGISTEEQKYIFDSFTQADGTTTRNYGGTGLGLTICKSLVELLGGNIHVESAPGKGSTFNFTLLAEIGNPAEVQKQGIPKSEDLPIIPLDILLVEDNEINQVIALEILHDMGATVTLAQNGKEAVDTWAEGHFDLILMDIQMPVMDGLTATKHIRNSDTPRSKTVPILAMTAHAMTSDREKSLENGMNDHITKPIGITELRDALVFWGTASKLDS